MIRAPLRVAALTAVWLSAGACANWDNPAALSDLQPTIEQSLSTSEVETFQSVEVEFAVETAGGHVMMDDATLELAFGATGTRSVQMTRDGEHYHAMVTFTEPGEYHAHLMGTPRGHALRSELGEFEFHVHPLHAQFGTWEAEVELESTPETFPATAHLVLTLLDAAETPAPGLVVTGELHRPDGTEGELTFEDLGDGRYEAEAYFTSHGAQELHLTVDGVEGEVHLFLPDHDAPADDAAGGHDTGGGHGH